MTRPGRKLFGCAFVVSLMVVAACTRVPSNQENADSISRQVDALFAAWDKVDSPGAAVAIVQNGKVIYKHGYGSANLEYGIPIQTDSIFHIASVSKQFTAFAVNLLARQGKVSLDDDIHKYLPEVPDFGKIITLRHLIHHTSGLRDQWLLLAAAGVRLDDVITTEDILKVVSHQRDLNFEPGAEHLYSNTGYTLLAEIVTRVSGQSFARWTAENIFKPLGMSSTHFHDSHRMIVKNRTYSYSRKEQKEQEGFEKSVLSYANVGATSLFTTVEDLALWLQNFEVGRVGGTALIQQMYQGGVLNSGTKISYASGLSVSEYRGLKVAAHGGSDAGFRSMITYFPDQRFGVIVLSNLASMAPSRLANQIADLYLENVVSSQKAAADRVAAKVTPAVYGAYLGNYMLADGTLVSLTSEGDRLFWEGSGHAPGQSKMEFFALAHTQSGIRFFLKALNLEFSFNHSEYDKHTTGFTLHYNGNDIPAIRLQKLTVAALEAFKGDYYSEELGTFYTLVVEDGKLVATHRRNSDIPLTHWGTDVFAGAEWFFPTLQFVRDSDGEVNGFLLSGGRVRNLEFRRRHGAETQL